MRFTTVGLTVVTALAATVCTPAWAQSSYPERPVRVVVGVAPGQTTDILARMLATSLTKTLGQSFYVENKAGAGATLGPDAVAKAAPDGYTLLVSSSGPFAISPALGRKLPYDPIKDFTPVGNAFTLPLFLALNNSFPGTSVKDLIAHAKKNPGKFNYASTGPGTTGHLGMEMFKSAAGVNLVHVPYKGAPAAINDSMSGLVQAQFDFGPVVLPQAKAGRIKVLGVASTSRSKAAPSIPTLAEQGMPGFQAGTFIAMFAPAGTPKPIVDKLNQELKKAVRSPEVEEFMVTAAGEIDGGTPEELAALLRKEMVMWDKVVKDAGIKVD